MINFETHFFFISGRKIFINFYLGWKPKYSNNVKSQEQPKGLIKRNVKEQTVYENEYLNQHI